MTLFCEFASALIAAFGSFCLGTSMGYVAQINDELREGGLGFDADEDDLYWIGATMTIGAALVCIPAGFLLKLIGRKFAMIGACVPSILGWCLIIFGKSRALVLVGRFLLGMGGGSFSVAAPVYTTEIAEVRFRGMFGTFFQVMITFGITYAYITGAFAGSIILHTALCGIPCIFLMVGLFFVPFSPPFLIDKGKNEKAKTELQKLRGKSVDVTSEINTLQDESNKLKARQRPLCSALCQKIAVKALFISIALMFAQQVGGINAFIFYSTEIFKEAHSNLKPEYVTILLGIVMFIATVIQVFLIDLAGRRILLSISASCEAFACFVFGIYFFLKDRGDDVSGVAWLPLIMIFLYIIGFSFGMGPIPWLMMGELFEEDVKFFAASIAGTTNWVFAFMVTASFGQIARAIGVFTCFWIFAIVDVLCVLFAIFVLPETKHKTFAEIQQLLGAKE